GAHGSGADRSGATRGGAIPPAERGAVPFGLGRAVGALPARIPNQPLVVHLQSAPVRRLIFPPPESRSGLPTRPACGPREYSGDVCVAPQIPLAGQARLLLQSDEDCSPPLPESTPPHGAHGRLVKEIPG